MVTIQHRQHAQNDETKLLETCSAAGTATRMLFKSQKWLNIPIFWPMRVTTASSLSTTTHTLILLTLKQVTNSSNFWTTLFIKPLRCTSPNPINSPSQVALTKIPGFSTVQSSLLQHNEPHLFDNRCVSDGTWLVCFQHKVILILIICPNVRPWVPFIALEIRSS